MLIFMSHDDYLYCMCSCIRGLLSEHLVILVTHQLQFALQANKILVVKEVIRPIKHF